MLGYFGNSDWRDMSEYVVHLTDIEGFKSILRNLCIEARACLGTARNLGDVASQQEALSLSEIPLDRLSRLGERHGGFGFGFTKDLVREKGGAPVWYLRRDSAVQLRFQELVRQAMLGGIDPSDPIWALTPFVENPGSGDGWRYEFDWEREWRVPKELKFEYSDVQFLVVDGPAGSKNQRTLGQYWAQQTPESVPSMFALDWSMKQLQALFARADLSDGAPSS